MLYELVGTTIIHCRWFQTAILSARVDDINDNDNNDEPEDDDLVNKEID